MSRDRLDSMAQAMALASDDENADWRSLLEQARMIDAAIHARRMFEL